MSTQPPCQFRGTGGEEFHLCTLQPSDAASLVAYIRAVLVPSEFFVTQADEYTETQEQAQVRIQEHLDSPNCLMMQASCQGQMIGLLVFTGGSMRRVAHCGSFHITVRSDFRNQGIGRELMKSLLGWAKANSVVKKISLTVMGTNLRAIKLYQEFGFAEEGRKIQEIQISPGVYVDDILMYRLVK